MFTEFFFNKSLGAEFAITHLLIVAVTFFLAGLAFKAYRNMGTNKMIYLIIAFAIFGILHLLNYIDQAVVYFMSTEVRYAMSAVVELAAMLMFVLAILRK